MAAARPAGLVGRRKAVTWLGVVMHFPRVWRCRPKPCAYFFTRSGE